MKILSSISHPHVVPNLYTFTCSVEHKIQYFKELLWKLNSSGSPLTSIIYFFPTLEGNGAPKRPGYKLFFKISSFVFNRTKKRIQFNNDRILIFGRTLSLIQL